MIRNYLKTTIRSLRKNKLFSIVNILGLSIGLTAVIFILQYAFFELSFDKFNKKSDRLFRVMNERFEGESLIQRGQITYSAVGPQMKEDYPEVVNSTTVELYSQNALRHKDKVHELSNLLLIEPSFFDMFSYEVLFGNPDEIVAEPNSLVLTESMAKVVLQETGGDWSKHIGEVITLGSSQMRLLLTGIVADPPKNSSLQFRAIISRSTMFQFNPNAKFSWNSSDYFHYVEISPDTDYKTLEKKFDDFSNRHFKGDEVTGTFEKFHLQPLEDVYLYSDYEYENHQTANGRMVWVLVLIAVFILLMAWVNYVNLTTSRSLQRAKEVGVRKVVGATKDQLIGQFLTESLVLNLLAFILAITFIQILQLPYNQLVEKDLSLWSFLTHQLYGLPVYLSLILTLVLGTFISGIYPAFVLSNFKPSESLKGDFGKSAKGRLLRKGLVTFQFALSTALIAGTFLVYEQTSFMRNQDMGIDMDQVITIESPLVTDLDTAFVDRNTQFVNSLLQNPRILNAGSSRNIFGEGSMSRVFNVRTSPEDEGQMLNRLNASFGFLEVYDVEMLGGRTFRQSDHNRFMNKLEAAIINEKAMKQLGFESVEAALNKKLLLFGLEWKIVGVTKDFNYRSLHQSIEPLLILPMIGGHTYHAKVEGSNMQETIAYIESTYDDFFPGDLFEYNFMDVRFDAQYRRDEQFGKIFNLFSLLAIGISCLGLFGLAGYTAIQKTKEIGIRKVLGATVSDILQLLSKEFLVLILIANAVTLPLIYLGGIEWLSAYEYQTGIGMLFFVLPLIVVLMISVLIVFSQTLKTAKRSPIVALRQD